MEHLYPVEAATRGEVELYVSVEALREFLFHRMRRVDRAPLGGADAVHAATALVHGFEAIVSPDVDLDHAPGLRRVEPGSALG